MSLAKAADLRRGGWGLFTGKASAAARRAESIERQEITPDRYAAVNFDRKSLFSVAEFAISVRN